MHFKVTFVLAPSLKLVMHLLVLKMKSTHTDHSKRTGNFFKG